MNKCYFCFPYW